MASGVGVAGTRFSMDQFCSKMLNVFNALGTSTIHSCFESNPSPVWFTDAYALLRRVMNLHVNACNNNVIIFDGSILVDSGMLSQLGLVFKDLLCSPISCEVDANQYTH